MECGAFHTVLPQIFVWGDDGGKKVVLYETDSQNHDGEQENKVCQIA